MCSTGVASLCCFSRNTLAAPWGDKHIVLTNDCSPAKVNNIQEGGSLLKACISHLFTQWTYTKLLVLIYFIWKAIWVPFGLVLLPSSFCRVYSFIVSTDESLIIVTRLSCHFIYRLDKVEEQHTGEKLLCHKHFSSR